MCRRSQLRRRSAKSPFRHGAAAVEFALVAPLFLLLLAGIIEFGQAFRIQHMLSNACRHGCRAAIVEGAASSRVQQIVKTHCAKTLGVVEGDVIVEITINGVADGDLSQAIEGDEVGVTVTVPYSKTGVAFFAKMFSGSVLSATCTLERE